VLLLPPACFGPPPVSPPFPYTTLFRSRGITMIVVPLVVASLLMGVASLGDIRKLGRIGGKTVTYYMATTAIAITVGLLLALAVRDRKSTRLNSSHVKSSYAVSCLKTKS